MDRWHITLEPGRYQQAPIAATKVELSPEEMTARIKKICRWFGCEQVGICEVTEDMKPFFYSVGRTRGTYTTGHANYVDNGREIPWPYPYKYCIVMADKCDTDTLNALTGPLVEASAKIACSQSDFAPIIWSPLSAHLVMMPRPISSAILILWILLLPSKPVLANWDEAVW